MQSSRTVLFRQSVLSAKTARCVENRAPTPDRTIGSGHFDLEEAGNRQIDLEEADLQQMQPGLLRLKPLIFRHSGRGHCGSANKLNWPMYRGRA